MPRWLERLYHAKGRDPDSTEVLAPPSRPKQRNANDCCVYVMKFMNYFLQGYDIASVGSWSQEVVATFRYRIARELRIGKPKEYQVFICTKIMNLQCNYSNVILVSYLY